MGLEASLACSQRENNNNSTCVLHGVRTLYSVNLAGLVLHVMAWCCCDALTGLGLQTDLTGWLASCGICGIRGDAQKEKQTRPPGARISRHEVGAVVLNMKIIR